jgi:tRNA (adenine22-N1)-methyltransferase
LLKQQAIKHGIAIENNDQPFQNSVDALKVFFPPRPSDGTASGIAEVRLGDGLSVLKPDEADSLSICGLGGRAIVRILDAHPERVPSQVVLQPNNRPEDVRQWALSTGFRLLDELNVGKKREFVVLSFERDSNGSIQDPAYRDVDLEAGILFGPLIIKRNEPFLLKQLLEEEAYWSQFSQLKAPAAKRLRVIEKLKTTLQKQDSN